MCYLCHAIFLDAQLEYVLQILCRLLIYDPSVFILRIFDIAVGWIRADWLARLALGFFDCLDLPAGVLCIEFVEDIDKRRHVVFCLAIAVDTVVYGDEADIRIRDNHLCVHANLQIIPSKSAHVFDDDRSHTVFIDKRHQTFPVRAVKVCAGKAVINEELCIGESILIRIFLQHHLLIADGVGIALQLIVL